MKFLIVFICFWEFAVINGIKVYRFGPEDGFICHCKNLYEQCDKQTGYCPSGCARAWFGPGCQYRDLAQLVGSVVSQTETNEREAKRAVDGDEKSCSSKKYQLNPWWKIWLPQNETITELYIISKDYQLKHFISTTVFIEYVPEAYKRNKKYEPQLSQLCYKDDNVRPENASFVIKCDKPFAGNQVRIQLEGTGYKKLVLCDVKINGGRNLAFDRYTNQSSTLYNNPAFSSGKAVDGDMATCTWTHPDEKDAWWNLVFGYTAIIQLITVTDNEGYTSRLNGSLLDASNAVVHYWKDAGNLRNTYKEANAIHITSKRSGDSITICETELYGDCGKNLCGFDCKTECHCLSMTIWTRIYMYANCSTAEMEVDEGRTVNRREDLGQESVCEDGSYGKSCIPCGYCLHNKSCDKTIGRCPDGCQSGYTGDVCNMECAHGNYGNQCNMLCNNNCRNGCNHVNGSCKGNCKDGWKGDKCDEMECSDKKYGQGCTSTCSTNCKKETCNHVSGKCENGCKDGWQGDKCGVKCSDKKYGEGCTNTCSTNCKKGTCNHVSGKCDDGCKDGWQGDKCGVKCSYKNYGQGCRNTCSTNCKKGTCNHVSGKCDDGCKDGWQGDKCGVKCGWYKYGTQCQSRCSPYCKQRTCNHVDGKCDGGCLDGWQGDTCKNKCSNKIYGQGCSNTCSTNCKQGTCNYVSGICDDGCKDGWQGAKCDVCSVGKYGEQCAHNCSEKCNYQQCDKANGKCKHGCKDGWFGDKCEEKCAAGSYGHRCLNTCGTNCAGGNTFCNHVDGTCTKGCIAGWRYKKCDAECDLGKYGDKCAETCSKNCRDRYRCNKVNGSCVNGCKNGWQGEQCGDACTTGTYGQDCKQQCSGNCQGGNKFCNSEDGTCKDFACVAGWKGKRCTKKCDVRMYGDKCTKRCNKNCKNGKCYHIDGKCEQGCKDGWHGDTCGDVCEKGKWGVGCKNLCGNCSDVTCDPVDGHCRGNCSIGFKFTLMCNQECDYGFYGSNCSETCGSCNNGTDCDKVTGICPNGCSSGYSGDLCISVVAKQASAGISIPVGIGAGVFLLLGLCLIVLFVKLGRRKRRVPADDGIELHHENVNNESKAGPSVTSPPSQPNKAKVEDGRSKSRVQVSKLLQYVKQNLSNKEKLISEFQTIPYGLKYASEAASLPVNIVKNRYREIYPYDHSRVMLSTIQGKPNSEYVNASYIQGRFRENAYIAAQGPTKESLDDFWRMIWEKDIRTIAILTNLVEEMKVKCIQYWGPQNSETVYGNLTVCNVSEHIFAEYTIRRFKVFYKKDREHDRTVIQFHYTAWPDKGVPRSTSSLVQFWNVVRQADSLKSHTWLVHCSAGVGRTGTFIAMDLLYDEGEDLSTVDIHHCVQTLREQRLNMVQTKEQYKFLHGLAVEMLVFPSKQVHLDAYSALYASLQTVDSQSGKSALLLQYEGLQDEISFMDLVYESCKIPKADDNDDRFAAAKLDTNKSKNRYQNVLPANEFRPFLASNVPGCTNYINAVYVQSYCNLRGYILTQTPMKETAIDCCRLLIEEEVKVIVTFNWKGKGKEDVGEYLPDNGTIELGPFTCTNIAETDESNYVLRKHKIFYKTESHETIVYQLIFKNWPTKGVIPSDSHSILDFLQAVEFYNRREAGKAIVVQCLNGAERSGLFVVLMNIMEHLRYESRVSIPHLIRCARVRREQIIPNFEQYKFCHDTLLSYVESNTTYANM